MSVQRIEGWKVFCDLCSHSAQATPEKKPPATWTHVGNVDACDVCSEKLITVREIAKVSAQKAAGAEDDCG